MRPRLALIVLALYLVLALTSAASKAPWVDEGWFASPAYNLITHGHMATHVLEPAGTWLEGIDHYTYWIMPADILAQAAWYKVFGFNLFTMRALSVAWGLFALAALYWVARHLTNDARLAPLAAALLALDYGFVQFTSSGRMDAMCVATGLAGLAAYLSLRRRSLVAAVLASQAFVALSGLTHPLGLLPFLGLLYLTLRLDRRRLRWRHALWAVAPYVAGVLAWGATSRRRRDYSSRSSAGTSTVFTAPTGGGPSPTLCKPYQLSRGVTSTSTGSGPNPSDLPDLKSSSWRPSSRRSSAASLRVSGRANGNSSR